jgi:hypothetical protein
MDDFVFSSGFNLANMTCQLVELGILTLFLPISTSWNFKFAKLKPLSLGLGCLMSTLPYPSKDRSTHVVEKWKKIIQFGKKT